MGQRIWVWLGAGLAVAAVAGLGVHFAAVGLDEADKLGSVVGALMAVVGVALTAFGLLGSSHGGGRRVRQTAHASGGRIVQVGGSQSGSVPSAGDTPDEVRQRARARRDGEVSQIAGDQETPKQP